MPEQAPIIRLDPNKYVYDDEAGRYVKKPEEGQSERTPSALKRKLAKSVLSMTLMGGMLGLGYGAYHMGVDFALKKAIQITHMPGLNAIDPTQEQLWQDLWEGK